MAEILERAISSSFPDARYDLQQVAGLPIVLCEVIQLYLSSETEFETEIITTLLNDRRNHSLFMDRRNHSLFMELRTALLASSNPYVEKWCSRVIDLYRTSRGINVGRSEALDHVLLVSTSAVCNRPSCYYSNRFNRCTCLCPLRLW